MGDHERLLDVIADILLVAAAITVAVLMASCVTDPRPRSGHIFDTSFGAVYCAEANVTPCGLWLTDCHDTHTYGCMTNVRERGD